MFKQILFLARGTKIKKKPLTDGFVRIFVLQLRENDYCEKPATSYKSFFV